MRSLEGAALRTRIEQLPNAAPIWPRVVASLATQGFAWAISGRTYGATEEHAGRVRSQAVRASHWATCEIDIAVTGD